MLCATQAKPDANSSTFQIVSQDEEYTKFELHKLNYNDIQPAQNIMSPNDRKRVYRVLVNNRYKAHQLKNVI